MDKKKRKHIYFSGRVQGVGFRYMAMHFAEAYGLTGWVDNLWDGRVEMEVQGEESSIFHMLTSLESGTFIRIDDCQIYNIPSFEDEYYFIVK